MKYCLANSIILKFEMNKIFDWMNFKYGSFVAYICAGEQRFCLIDR